MRRRPSSLRGALSYPGWCTVRFRTPWDRPHEEQPVRHDPVSVGSILVAVTLKPAEEMPTGVHAADVLADLAEIVAEAVEDWWEHLGYEFCQTCPDVA